MIQTHQDFSALTLSTIQERHYLWLQSDFMMNLNLPWTTQEKEAFGKHEKMQFPFPPPKPDIIHV